MIITIEIAPGLEQQFRQEAARVSLTPDAYILKAVQERLTQTSQRHHPTPHLSPEEAHLLAKINLGLSPTEWERVRHTTLDAVMSELGLTPDAHG